MTQIFVASAYGKETRLPLVQVQVCDNDGTVQQQVGMSPAEAIKIAGDLIECATFALADAMVVNFITQHVGAPVDTSLLLMAFRAYRQQLEEGNR